MHKLDDFKVYVMFSVASLLMPIAYYLKDKAAGKGFLGELSPGQALIVASIIFVFGATIARVTATQLLKIRKVRQWILGASYVEGYWLLRTEQKSGKSTSLNTTGIAFMHYKTQCREFKIETTRYEDKRRYVTQSEVGYVRTTGSTIRYLNFFNLTFPNPDGENGYSSGSFSYGDHFSKFPQYFDAVIALQDSEYTGGQYAERIPDDIVKEYRSNCKSPSHWMRYYLEDVEAKALNNMDSTSVNLAYSEVEGNKKASNVESGSAQIEKM